MSGAGGSAPRLAAPRTDATKRPQPLPRAPEAPTLALDLTLLARPRRGLAAQAAKGTHGQASASGSWATLGAASRGPRGSRPRHPTCFGAFGWPTAYRLRLPALRDAHPRGPPDKYNSLAGPPPRCGGTRCATGRARGCTVAALAHLAGLARLPRTPHCLVRCPHPRAPRTLRGAHCWRRRWRALAPASQAQPPAAPAGAPPPPGARLAARQLRSLRSLRIGGGRAACGGLFRAHGLRPSARRPPAVARVLAPARPPPAPPAAVALRASLAWAVRARRSRCRCSGPAGPCNGPRPVRPLGLRGPRVGTACGHAATLARSRSGPPALRFAPSRAGGLPGLRAGQGLRAPHF